MVGALALDGFCQFLGANYIGFGYDLPVVGVPINAGYHSGGKLEDWELFVGAFKRSCGGNGQQS